MIVLAVMTYNGAATQPVEASFDELGGTIGRADGNLMVLPDPERTISRVHAKVVFRNGTYAVEDRGSNPILVNGNVVGHGKEWPLAPGDVLQIGGYELGVRASGSPAVSDDPFADVFAAGGAKVMAPAPAPAFAAPPPPVTAARRTAPAPPPGAVGIPSDWDPLAEETFAGRSPAPAAGRDEGDAGGLLGAGGAEESIDDLFGLGDKAAKPGAGWPADDDFLGVFDPGSPSVGGVGERVDKPRIEDARLDHQRSELAAAFPSSMPTARTVPPAPQPRVPDPPSPPTPVPALGEAPRGAVVSWDGGARQATIVAPASAGRRQGGGAMASISGGTRPGIRPRAPASAEAQAPAPATGGDELLRALLEGLGGVQAPGITALTPGLMKLVGTLLAESVRGAVDLLQARASIKREVRAEVTAIRPRQNNPLKFSPTAALALQHLLGPPVPGFLRADEAMRDAYRDLRAHELAVMAGMRSALAGLLQRFDPKALESRITGKSGLGMLLAGGRRAQLWEAYQELFGQLSAEAEDDFHQVFGRAFLQAYEDQLDRLNNSEGGGKQLMLGIEVAILSDKGGRSYNEDACGHWNSERHLCCVLADGAGGHGGGDVASRLAVETLLNAFGENPTSDGDALSELIWDTNEALLGHRSSDKRLRDMHTTVVCLVIDFVDRMAHWSHVGDSRLYWFRDGRVRDRTLDHSLVQSLINAGVLTPEQAREHPRRSELQSALGTRPEDLQVGASGGSVEVQAGDAFLLCSDGLWEFVTDEAMEHALGGAASPSAWIDALEHQVREAARSRASHDNFSALAVWLVEPLGEDEMPAEEA